MQSGTCRKIDVSHIDPKLDGVRFSLVALLLLTKCQMKLQLLNVKRNPNTIVGSKRNTLTRIIDRHERRMKYLTLLGKAMCRKSSSPKS